MARAKKQKTAPPRPRTRGRQPYNPESSEAKRRNRKVDAQSYGKNGDLQLRDRFITEYLRDFNQGNAYVRALGPEEVERRQYKRSTCQNMGYMLRHEPYVAAKIAEAVQAMEEEHIVNRKSILAGLVKEANYDEFDSQHGARVSAWSMLAKIMSMDVKRIEANLSSRGGILVVPGSQSVDDWEKRSGDAQRKLKEAVRK